MNNIELLDLLKAGVHFGHQRSRWHPKMKPYIFTVRNGICIIDLEKTVAKLKEALAFVRDVRAKDGTILFVGTKRQARAIVKAAAERVHMPAVTERWIGGTFTNFATVSKIINKLTTLKSDRASGQLEKYTKKERLVMDREIERLEKVVGGIEQLQKLPEAVFLVDIKQERTAVREAQKMHLPIIALVDTNTNPEGIAFPIPANDDATKSIQLMANAIADAVDEGAQLAAARPVESVTEAAPDPVTATPVPAAPESV